MEKVICSKCGRVMQRYILIMPSWYYDDTYARTLYLALCPVCDKEIIAAPEQE